MKKHCRKLLALLLAVMCCMSMLTMAAGCSKKEDDTVSASEVSDPSGILYGDDGIPYLYENFENPENLAIARGDSVALEVVDREDGGKALKVSGRTDSWNGANFPAEVFSGNKVRCSADLICVDSEMRISLQYDLAGATSYAWVVSTKGTSSFTNISEVIDIPEGAANVFVYVESSGLSDITVDNLKVTVEGDYNAPAAASPLSYADYSGYPELKELYKDNFTFGCAIPTMFVDNDNQEYIKLVTKEFNTVTLENELKPDGILDYNACKSDLAKYNESPATDFSKIASTLDYCKANGISVRGHTLLWHQQTPEWLFYEDYDTSGKLASRGLMLKRMENYIKTVFTWAQENYPGLFYAWDVVNEACDDGTFKVRQSKWYETVGEDYVQKAFEYARKYAPDGVKLFYNDYNSYQAAKRNGIIEILKPVAKAGNIDGVGMQSHIGTGVNVDTFVESARKYVDELGVVINITELDVEMPGSANKEYDQGMFMRKFFSALVEADNNGLPIENVTVWGICDPLSWKASNKPVLFNGDLSKKLAFDGVVCAVTGEELPVPDDYVAPGSGASPITDDFEGTEMAGKPRATCKLKITTDEAYEGKGSLNCSGGTDTWDGYSINVTDYIGSTLKYSFAIKSKCPECRFSADIDGVWPNIEQIDTSSGDWVYCEGTYDCPADMTELYVYFESTTMDEFFLDSVKIEPAA